MGGLSIFSGQKIYLDTNIFIYAIEGSVGFGGTLTEIFSRFDLGEATSFTSELALAEALVRPFEKDDVQIQRIYQERIRSSSTLTVVPITRQILVEAARLRSRVRLKMPDAIHAATAYSVGCGVFVTNDSRFVALEEIRVVLLSHLAERK